MFEIGSYGGQMTHLTVNTNTQELDSALKRHDGKVYQANSGWLVVSKNGTSALWSGGFSGCVGVVLSNTSEKWGCLCHINQNIDEFEKGDPVLAFTRLREFVFEKLHSYPTDMFVYYGSPKKTTNSTFYLYDKIKETMGCDRDINMLRSSLDEKSVNAWSDKNGSEFVYFPGTQTVFTMSGFNMVKYLDKFEDPKATTYAYRDGEQAKLPGFVDKGWSIVE